jgi:protoporphyrinogen oxidase
MKPLLEFFCWEGDEIWNMSKEDLLNITANWLEKMNFITRDKIMDVFHIEQKYVYPVYDLDYQKNLDVLKKYLDGFSNLIYNGRPSRFKYTNQDHSLEMGILAARSILEGKKLNIENVAAEQEYFEKGYIK